MARCRSLRRFEGRNKASGYCQYFDSVPDDDPPPLLHLARCAVAAAIVINPPARTERKPIISVETRNTAQAFTRREAGVYAGDAAVRALVARTPGLRSWGGWFKSPTYLKNGHAHTIFAAKFRWTASIVYRRHLLTTSDGGSLAPGYRRQSKR